MIVASLFLVIVAAVTLVIGLFNQDTVEWVYASIGCCVLAGLLLTIGVLRSRPSRKPVLQADGQPASWAGAQTWGGSGDDDVLNREDPDSSVSVLPPGQDEAVGSTGSDDPPVSSTDETTQWAAPPSPEPAPDPEPMAAEVGAPPVVETPPGAEAPVAPEPYSPPSADDVEAPAADTPAGDEETVLPKRSAAARRGGAIAAGAGAMAAFGDDDELKRIEKALKPIAGVGPAKRVALAERFGTYRKLRNASVERIAEVPGVSATLAQRIHTALREK